MKKTLIYAPLFMETAHFRNPLHNNNSPIFQQPFNEKQFRYDVKDKILEKLVSWAISLREVANYQGDAVLFFYKGPIPRKVYNLLKDLDIELLYIDRGFRTEENYTSVTYYRHVDALNYINKKNYDYIISYDLDVWFDRDINDIFNDTIIPKNGCLHSGEWMNPTWIGHPKDVDEAFEFYNKLKVMKEKFYTKAVMGYFFAANEEMFIKRIEEYKTQLEIGLIPLAWGSDQFLLNYLFDIENDTIDHSMVFDTSSSYWKFNEEEQSYYAEIFPPYERGTFKKAYSYHNSRGEYWDKDKEKLDFKQKHQSIYTKYWDINYPFDNQH